MSQTIRDHEHHLTRRAERTTTTAQIETITPERAYEMLANNRHNRNMRQTHIETLKGALERGEWSLTGQGITFDREGNLIDGQHRLMAIFESGQTVDMVVVRGAEPHVYNLIDRGQAKTFADDLHRQGYTATAHIAAAVHALFRYQLRGDFAKLKYKPTANQLAQTFAENPAIESSVRIMHRFKAGIGMQNAIVVVCHYLLMQTDPQSAEVFFDRLLSGTNLSDSDPIYHLRERLQQQSIKRTLSDNEVAALIFKAWNAFLQGNEVRQLRWVGGGAKPEEFPTPLSPAEIG